MVIWDRSDVIVAANPRCRRCNGLGLASTGPGGRQIGPCDCALRGIFRLCLRHYHELRAFAWCEDLPLARWLARIEYIADFELVCRRHLDRWHHLLFRLHFLQMRPWHECIAPLRTSRGNFYHAVYRIEELLGRAMHETRPYPLWPPWDYELMPRLRCRPFPASQATREGEVRQMFARRVAQWLAGPWSGPAPAGGMFCALGLAAGPEK